MGSEAAAYKEWERFMDHCARRVLEEHGEGFNQRRVPPKSIKVSYHHEYRIAKY